MVKCYWIVLANKLVLALQKVYIKLCDDNLSNLEKNGYLFTLYKVLKKQSIIVLGTRVGASFMVSGLDHGGCLKS